VLFTSLIKSSDPVAYPQHQLFRTLGINLVLCAPPKEIQKSILREIWKVLDKLDNPIDYITCAEIFIEIPSKHFTVCCHFYLFIYLMHFFFFFFFFGFVGAACGRRLHAWRCHPAH